MSFGHLEEWCSRCLLRKLWDDGASCKTTRHLMVLVLCRSDQFLGEQSCQLCPGYSAILQKTLLNEFLATKLIATKENGETSKILQVLRCVRSYNFEHGIRGQRKFILRLHHAQRADVFGMYSPYFNESCTITIGGSAESLERFFLVSGGRRDRIPANLKRKE